jgi:hypothetical protein
LVAEVSDKRTDAEIIDRSSPSSNVTTAFLDSTLKPCRRMFCPTDLKIDNLTVTDPMTIEILGTIEESPREMQRRRPVGKYRMILKRKVEQPSRWLVYEIVKVG